ncbi:tRNA-dependent cyclodipeptide synthase [Streptomyces iconiensis]|uniref:Cyclodipeptide synthase n=2 Tax=Streptomyces iconiensis TaxID=1384038 RepID=A0ABT6ZNB3_9ACTN|nr:tRNA-dependent cyclodipeptide synthase [Streptomyces iconiensis]MDJ1130547.1 tRNA-dependent cyclodipeptide synthase [Streptomyces iconiensis]
MYVKPLGAECRRIWQRGDHALIGVSAGNSYFNQERLTKLLKWAGHSFAEIDVVYVDTHLDTMLIADGRAPLHAAKSSRSTIKDLRRRIRRSVELVDPDGVRLRVRSLTEVMDLPEYQKVRLSTDLAMREDPEFAATCEKMVRQVVGHRSTGDGNVMTKAHIEAGLSYLQAEAPLFVDSPSIFDVRSSVVCYHMLTPITDQLCRRDSSFRCAPENGYLIVRPTELGES